MEINHRIIKVSDLPENLEEQMWNAAQEILQFLAHTNMSIGFGAIQCVLGIYISKIEPENRMDAVEHLAKALRETVLNNQ